MLLFILDLKQFAQVYLFVRKHSGQYQLCHFYRIQIQYFMHNSCRIFIHHPFKQRKIKIITIVCHQYHRFSPFSMTIYECLNITTRFFNCYPPLCHISCYARKFINKFRYLCLLLQLNKSINTVSTITLHKSILNYVIVIQVQSSCFEI